MSREQQLEQRSPEDSPPDPPLDRNKATTPNNSKVVAKSTFGVIAGRRRRFRPTSTTISQDRTEFWFDSVATGNRRRAAANKYLDHVDGNCYCNGIPLSSATISSTSCGAWLRRSQTPKQHPMCVVTTHHGVASRIRHKAESSAAQDHGRHDPSILGDQKAALQLGMHKCPLYKHLVRRGMCPAWSGLPCSSSKCRFDEYGDPEHLRNANHIFGAPHNNALCDHMRLIVPVGNTHQERVGLDPCADVATVVPEGDHHFPDLLRRIV